MVSLCLWRIDGLGNWVYLGDDVPSRNGRSCSGGVGAGASNGAGAGNGVGAENGAGNGAEVSVCDGDSVSDSDGVGEDDSNGVDDGDSSPCPHAIRLNVTASGSFGRRAEAAGPPKFEVEQNVGTQGARRNAAADLRMPLATEMVGNKPAPAWNRPPFVALPAQDVLGDLSLHDDAVRLDDESVRSSLKMFDAALVGRLFGKKIPYSFLLTELKRRWDHFGQFRLITISVDSFICFFESVEARDAIIVGGPWLLAGQVLGIDRWSPSFSPSSSDGFITPVWIRLIGLPLYCWGAKNIARISASLGEPLGMDAATDRMERGQYARVCVRVDLSKPLKPGIWVHGLNGRFFQPIEYEGLSNFCFQCGCVGHKVQGCKNTRGIGNPHTSGVENDRPVGVQQKQSVQIEKVAVSSDFIGPEPQSTVQQGIGPWMLVVHKRRPPRGGRSKGGNNNIAGMGAKAGWIPRSPGAINNGNHKGWVHNISQMDEKISKDQEQTRAGTPSPPGIADGGMPCAAEAEASRVHVESLGDDRCDRNVIHGVAATESVHSMPEPDLDSDLEVPPHDANRRKSLVLDWIDFTAVTGKRSKSKKKKKKNLNQASHRVTRSQVKKNFLPGALPPWTPARGRCPLGPPLGGTAP